MPLKPRYHAGDPSTTRAPSCVRRRGRNMREKWIWQTRTKTQTMKTWPLCYQFLCRVSHNKDHSIATLWFWMRDALWGMQPCCDCIYTIHWQPSYCLPIQYYPLWFWITGKLSQSAIDLKNAPIHNSTHVSSAHSCCTIQNPCSWMVAYGQLTGKLNQKSRAAEP